MTAMQRFMQRESAPGMLLVAAGALAFAVANSPLTYLYDRLWNTPLSVRVGALLIDKPLLLWINDGLMAVFFLLVGLEIKREVLRGELSEPRKLALPAFGALGGMLLPALIYTWFNHGDPVAMRGWAIPAATDIAFALGVLTLFGDRAPNGLKAFLLTLAILDDLGAIVIIALFYTDDLSARALVLAGIALVTLVVMNLAGVTNAGAYVLVGIALWVCVLKSGVHATLAGVAVGLAVPLRTRFADVERRSPLLSLEHALKSWVVFGILPIFALANAGVRVTNLAPSAVLQPVPLGIMAGLIVGKLAGVFSFSAGAVLLRAARLPAGVTWSQLLGASMLCGIGFTMSLFIAGLAFGQAGDASAVTSRLGILVGSAVAAVLGSLILARALPAVGPPDEGEEPGAFLTGG